MVANLNAVTHKRLEDRRMLLNVPQHRGEKHPDNLLLPVLQCRFQCRLALDVLNETEPAICAQHDLHLFQILPTDDIL